MKYTKIYMHKLTYIHTSMESNLFGCWCCLSPPQNICAHKHHGNFNCLLNYYLSVSGNTSTAASVVSVAAAASRTTTSLPSSYTKGVLQTIGFKEFIPYLEQFNAANDQKIETYLQANAYKMPTEGKNLYLLSEFFLCLSKERENFSFLQKNLNYSEIYSKF